MSKPGPTARELQRLRKDVATALKVAATNAQLATNLRHVLSQNDALRARVRELRIVLEGAIRENRPAITTRA